MMRDRQMTLVEYRDLYLEWQEASDHFLEMVDVFGQEQDRIAALECADILLELREGAKFLVG